MVQVVVIKTFLFLVIVVSWITNIDIARKSLSQGNRRHDARRLSRHLGRAVHPQRISGHHRHVDRLRGTGRAIRIHDLVRRGVSPRTLHRVSVEFSADPHRRVEAVSGGAEAVAAPGGGHRGVGRHVAAVVLCRYVCTTVKIPIYVYLYNVPIFTHVHRTLYNLYTDSYAYLLLHHT